MAETANKIDVNIFSDSFEKAKQNGLDKKEKQKLRDLFFKLPKEKQEDILKKYKNLKQEPEKSFFDGLKQKLDNLKNDIEKVELKGGFEEIKENFKDSEVAQEFFDLIESYIDLKLDNSFSKKQKDQIKLALLGEIESGFNLNTIGEGLLNKVLKPLKQKIEKLKGGDLDNATNTDDIPGMSEVEKSMTEMFEDFGLDLKVKELNEKITKINKQKDLGKISDLKSVLTIINPDDVLNINFNTIKSKTANLVGILDKGRNATNDIQEGLKKLPFNLGDTIISWIKGVIKKGGILGMILGFFFGKEFMDESNDKQVNSLDNFKKYADSSDFVLKENFKKEDLKSLKPKDLEKFYKYLDSKKIDYSTEAFWQELLTGKTKNTKILEVYNLLKNTDGKVLNQKDNLDDFTKKINSLSDLEEQKEQEKLQAQSQQLQTEIQTTQTELQQIEIQKAKVEKQQEEIQKNIEEAQEKNDKTAEEEAKRKAEEARKKAEELAKEEQAKKEALAKQEAEKKKIEQEKEFNDSIHKITSLPAEIVYKGEKIKLDIENNKTIILGKDIYKIEVVYIGSDNEYLGPKKGEDILKKVDFKNNNLKITTKYGGGIGGLGELTTNISKKELISTLKELLEGNNYINPGKKTTFKISKII